MTILEHFCLAQDLPRLIKNLIQYNCIYDRFSNYLKSVFGGEEFYAFLL